MQDFDSPSLKTKKHWNSFATTFFLPLNTARRQLETEGKLVIDATASKELLAQPMSCHKCGESLGNIPKLKDHIAGCTAKLDPEHPLY